jgi:signal transduction histidine kinase
LDARASSAAAVPPGAAAAVSSGRAGVLLDAAFRRAVTVLAHDLRNTVGALALQVEAVGASAGRQPLDAAAVTRHADAAGTSIEGMAETLEALLAFARGRVTSDLGVVARELARLAPLRRCCLRCSACSIR